jgi:uncharacterized glyoxalase superfamily protein PhnB
MSETPGPNISPVLRYRDAAAAMDWLENAVGFERVADYRDDDGNVVHAEMRYGTGMIMVSDAREGDVYGPHTGTGWAYVVVDDADAHYARAQEAGAEILRPIEDQDYGSRDYSARDPEGNIWSFGTYQPSLEPPPGD